MIEGFAAVVKKRRYHKRTFIILLIIAFEMEMFALHGKWDCMYLYFKRVLSWTMTEYGQYVSILGFLGLIAQYAVVPLLSVTFKLHDSTIALIGKRKIILTNAITIKLFCQIVNSDYFKHIFFFFICNRLPNFSC